ncbi:hypothetical protein JXA63_02555 [Candidatus Woesebacteria bacterium]|nr:hypothetical protein [Candidatus Woesebacteria bacterium]
MKSKKYIILIAVFLALFSLGIFLLLRNRVSIQEQPRTNNYDVNNGYSVQNTNNNKSQNVTPDNVQVSFLVTELDLNQNQQHTSTLSFDILPDPAPVAFTLVLEFDPSSIQVNDIEPGNLWTGENILQKEIDNENGIVNYSVGQGFYKEVTGESQIAKITFTSSSTDTEIEIDSNKSMYAFAEEDGTVVGVSMKGSPLIISVE